MSTNTEPKEGADIADDAMNPSTSEPTTGVVSTTTADVNTLEVCIAEGCNNAAVQHAEWDNEYCSVSCTYNHCKATFNAWLENNKISKAKAMAASATQVNVAVNPDQQSATSSTT